MKTKIGGLTMNEIMKVSEIIKLLLPLIVVNYLVVAYCIYSIWTKGTENLTKPIWTIIVLFISGFGVIGFLLLGRKKTYDQD